MVGYSKVTASRWLVDSEEAFCEGGGCDYYNELSHNGGENYFFTQEVDGSSVQRTLDPIA